MQLYLATPESAVRPAGSSEPGERYRIQVTGRSGGLPGAVTNYEMTAVVDERGLVRMSEAEFSIPGDSDANGVSDRKHVRLAWTYNRINSTGIWIITENTARMTAG